MKLKPVKPAAKISLRVGVRKFSAERKLEEWDSNDLTPITLADKISEYILRIGEANAFCLNIVIQLLTKGKVRVDFRDSSERLQLISEKDIVSRGEAVRVFDQWLADNQVQSEPIEATQKILMEPPKVNLPRGET
jgi:hypothetical protein